MKKPFMILTVLLTFIPTFASTALRVEYRLETKSGGQKFEWSHEVAGGANAAARNLEGEAFMSNADFVSFGVKSLQSSSSKSNVFEVELVHSEKGRKKFASVANKGRERGYCVIIGNEIYQCLGFAPITKSLWDKSTSVYGPFSEEQANRLKAALEGR